jgi:hypothetical protein
LRKIALLILFIVGFSVIYSFDQWYIFQSRKVKIKEFESVANLYQTRLESAIERRLNATEALVSLIKIHPDDSLFERIRSKLKLQRIFSSLHKS